jgi:hypothetical protein
MSAVTAHDRFVNLAVVALVASAFGPYLIGGVRTDQAVAYPLAVSVVLFAPWTWLRWRPTVIATNLFIIWAGYLIAAASGLLGVVAVASWPPGSLFAGLDNLLLPFMVMALVWLLVTPERRDRMLNVACKTLAWCTAANGIIAAVNTRVDLAPFLRPFWAGAGGDGSTVAERAAALGRYSGVFNQPAEAGLMYGLAGLGLLYAYRDRQKLLYLLMIPIFVGGVLCVSKVFLLVGGPIILWQLWRVARSRAVLLLGIAVALLGAAQSRLLQAWSGAEYLQRLIRPQQTNYVDLYTAGRLGDDSTLSTVASQVWDRAPWLGFGARGLQVAYDNGWVEALVVAGVAGVIAYSAVLLMVLLVPRTLDGPPRRLAWGLALLTIGASVGVPALTANRSGMVLWLLLALLVVRQVTPDERRSGQVDALGDAVDPHEHARRGSPHVAVSWRGRGYPVR